MNAPSPRAEPCKAARSVGAYADGELEPNRAVEVEEHLSHCRTCRDELELIQATRKSLRRSMARPAPSDFAARMLAVVEIESQVSPEATDRSSSHAVPARPALTEKDRTLGQKVRARASWGVTMAVAAAAGFVLAFFGSRSDILRNQGLKTVTIFNSRSTTSPLPTSNSEEKRAGFEALLDRLVSFHANPPPSEEDEFDTAVHKFEPLVGVHMQGTTLRRPVFGARFSGARIYDLDARSANDTRFAAELRYTTPGHRITIYVFDPSVVPIRVTRLKPRVVRSSPNPVYVGTVRGFSVAAAERSGIGYAVASDFDDEKSAQLVANF
jgi:hypothetical protein